VEFLDTLSATRILRQAGGGYQFRHREILEHLAREAPTPGLMELRDWASTGSSCKRLHA
jgi:hypothetical protein